MAATCPTGLSFDAETMTFSGTPESDDEGEIEVKVTATDGSDESATDTFTLTVEEDTTAPEATFKPLDDATGVAIDSDILVTFNEEVQIMNTAGVVLHQGSPDGEVVEPEVSLDGSTLTVDPTGALVNGTEYYLTFDGDAVSDLAGNYYDEDEYDAYHFSTLDAAVAASGGSDGIGAGGVIAGVAGIGLLVYLIFWRQVYVVRLRRAFTGSAELFLWCTAIVIDFVTIP